MDAVSSTARTVSPSTRTPHQKTGQNKTKQEQIKRHCTPQHGPCPDVLSKAGNGVTMSNLTMIVRAAAFAGALTAATAPAMAQVQSNGGNAGPSGNAAYDDTTGRLGTQPTQNQPVQIIRFPNSSYQNVTGTPGTNGRPDCDRNSRYYNPNTCR
jgi:hypothetical protein